MTKGTGGTGGRVVCSLTTIPSRLVDPHFPETFATIFSQDVPFDAIYLTIPHHSNRLKKPYPEIPKWILSDRRITVVRTEKDYGPITKIVGALLSESDPETIIFTCDDDVKYPSNLVSSFLEKSKNHPDAAIGSHGIQIGSFPGYLRWNPDETRHGHGKYPCNFTPSDNPTYVDILNGYSSVMYRRKFFQGSTIGQLEDNFLSKVFENRDIYLNDDIYISSYLNSQNIPRIVYSLPSVEVGKMDDPLSASFWKCLRSLTSSINTCQEWGLIRNRVPVNFFETATGFGLFVLFLIVLIIVGILMIFSGA
jgi:hypothetical protein